MTTADAKASRSGIENRLRWYAVHAHERPLNIDLLKADCAEAAERISALEASHSLTEAWTVDGSIYTGMEASLSRDGVTVAHFPAYAEAVRVADLLQAARPIAPVQDDDAEWLRRYIHDNFRILPERERLERIANRLGKQSLGDGR
jgi:hypothetical protein